MRGTTFKRPGLDATPKPHIGHYGRLRKAYLEQYRHRLYTALVASEKLYPHLAETDRAARDMLDYLMPRLAREAGATEALKAADPMKWVGLMNNCKARAEEIVMHELIYV
ncbi:TnpV protein [Flavonifractor sp. An82]|uniref:TnpV protein n=1 Tax=Flavonifractor sp. An82 TaxID=1965660 RepID=UPI001FA826F0|nr:TnpV protein [Flavonifractor sp. An82]